MFGTPTVYVDIMSVFEKLSPKLQDNNLKFGITGGATCSPILMTKFNKMFPRAKILVFNLKLIINNFFFHIVVSTFETVKNNIICSF